MDARGHVLDLAPIETLLARIEKTWRPQQVWLFGSRARGDAGPRSDWDLLVVVDDGVDERALDPRSVWQVQRGSGCAADVFVCHAREFRDACGTVNTLAYDVAHEGVLLRER